MFVEQKKNIELPSAYDDASEYASYLKYTKGNTDDLYVYLDEDGEGYVVTVYNHSEYFWTGNVELRNNHDTVATYLFVNLRPEEVRYLQGQFDVVPTDYAIKESKFYTCSYPVPEVSAEVSYDSNLVSEYAWVNYVIEAEQMTEDVCVQLAKRYYVEAVLSGMPMTDLYFYSTDSVEYVSENGLSFPRTSTAVYGAVMNAREKTITLTNIQGEQIIPKITVNMPEGIQQ